MTDTTLPDISDEFQTLAHDELSTLSGDKVPAASAEPELLALDSMNLRSHARIAYVAAAHCVDRFIHVAGLGWLQWTGQRFVPDIEDKAVTRAVLNVIRDLAADSLGNKDLLADLTKCQTSGGLAGVVRIMSTLESLTAQVEELDADAWLLNTPTGVLDLREIEAGTSWHSLTVQEHDPKFRMTQITEAEYNPGADARLWERFITTSLPDEEVRGFLQTSTGVALIGQQLEHVLPVLTGKGRNGKGVHYGALHHALGDYAAVASPNLFNVDRNATADKPNPALLSLRARRIVFMSETAKSAEMDAARIKSLTGGDRIAARGVHSKTIVEFDPSHQLVLITNHAPQLPADDPAVWERVTLVPWDVVVPKEDRDPRLGSKLEKQSDAILSWSLAGLQTYFSDGLIRPARVEEATQQYKDEQDTVATFVAERCESDCADTDSDATKALHADYQKFCRANGVMREHMLGERDFGTRLGELGYPSKKSGSRRYRQGLRLVPDREQAWADEQRAAVAARVAATYPTAPSQDGDDRPGVMYKG